MASARLRQGSSEQAGLDPRQIDALAAGVDELPARGWCAGAVVAAGRGPYLVLRHATGWAWRWSTAGTLADEPERMRPDTPFDLASLTKLFTAVAVLQQVERGTVDLDRPAAAYVREFGGAGKAGITLRQLLTHTSGLRPELPFHDGHGLELLWSERPLPGRRHRYSDLNFLALQQVLEQVTGQGLDVLLGECVTGPLRMSATRFGPVLGAAATEDQRRPRAKADRGMLRGVVHDENAYALGGVAGHAGLFGTADDLAVFCRALLGGGAYGRARILAPDSVALLLDAPGLGFTVDQPWFMGELAGRGAAGHTGFTGTSLVVDRATDTFLVLLANTVHPVRPAVPDSSPRAEAATRLARAVR
ncbi:beta-lactamase family protein [Streptomyces durbertensis]|uniref:Beta-lactamase family protein n=1 Tax=Streptomyces durbertensis TaxID=2448886 RepID=A0ABR6EMM2_9ACTN|nr:serine hydrolase domain-containing protein [Streptomyces durbertensis]MBB1246150.1 beta-lactamase family protein [Streptomyces durbertensis]